MNASHSGLRHFIVLFKQATLSNKLILGLACWFGFGLAPKAPGTLGTLAAVPFVFLMDYVGPLPGLGLVLTVIFLSIWIAGRAQTMLAQPDPQVIVIDEAVGLWVALYALPLSFLSLLSGFLLFRLFDIIKPYPIKKLERLKGGFGIVLDDFLAGIYANLILRLIIFVIN